MHRMNIGRTREVRGPDALERGFAGMIIAVVMTIAVWFGNPLVRMTQTLDAVSLVEAAQIDATIYHAEHGRWPSPDGRNILAGREGAYTRQLTLGEGGVITAELALGPAQQSLIRRGAGVPGDVHGLLSFRPELLGSKDEPTVAFLCGYAEPVAGAIEIGASNRTTLSRKYLPPFCR